MVGSTCAVDYEARMTTVVLDNTNHFACIVKIGDKIGNSLFVKTTAGLPDNEKPDFNIEKAQDFKDELDCANAKYAWGLVTFEITTARG